MDGCGIINILVESEVLAEGSANTFLNGKHFNRCKRIHPILSSALQVLHIEMFLTQNDLVFDEKLVCNLKYLQTKLAYAYDSILLSPELEKFVNDYRIFVELTLGGQHGKTAMFYIQYVEYMNIFFRFSRAIRTTREKFL